MKGTKQQQKDQFECKVCGATDNKPRQCCGRPMEKINPEHEYSDSEPI